VRLQTMFNPSDHRETRCSESRHRGVSVLFRQPLHEALLSAAQHLLRQRRKIAEHPHQIYALFESQSNVTRANWRFNLKNAIGKFVHPHDQPALGRGQLRNVLQSPTLLHQIWSMGRGTFSFL